MNVGLAPGFSRVKISGRDLARASERQFGTSVHPLRNGFKVCPGLVAIIHARLSVSVLFRRRSANRSSCTLGLQVISTRPGPPCSPSLSSVTISRSGKPPSPDVLKLSGSVCIIPPPKT